MQASESKRGMQSQSIEPSRDTSAEPWMIADESVVLDERGHVLSSLGS